MQKNTKHGASADYKTTPTYDAWRYMNSECDIESDIWKRPRWDDFENFLEDMGERPEGTMLVRIDYTDDFYKENCLWATPEERHAIKLSLAEEINEFYNMGCTTEQIADYFGITQFNTFLIRDYYLKKINYGKIHL